MSYDQRDVEQKRAELIRLYPRSTRFQKMPPAQVIAIYLRLKAQGRI